MKAIADILKGILVGVLAGGIALLTMHKVSASPDASPKIAISELPSAPLTVHSSVDEVLALMLESDQKWDSLVATYQLSVKDPATSETTIQAQHFWLNKKGAWARVEIDDPDSVLFIRNASTIAQENRNKKVYFQTQLPNTFKYNDFNPRDLLLNASGAVYFHPYGKVLPTGYYDFLYPTAIAQSMIFGIADGQQEIQIVGEDIVAGRSTIVISRMPKNHFYWVDTVTGVVLRAEYWGDSENWQTQFEAQNIAFDITIPGSVFQFSPSLNSKLLEPAEFIEQSRGEN